MDDFELVHTGIGTEKPNAWAFDTTQFDSILKKLKVVSSVSFVFHGFYLIHLFRIIDFNYSYCVRWQQAVGINKDEGKVT